MDKRQTSNCQPVSGEGLPALTRCQHLTSNVLRNEYEKSIILLSAKTIIMATFMGCFFSLLLLEFSGWSNDLFLFGCFLTIGSTLHWRVVSFFFRSNKRDLQKAHRITSFFPVGFGNLAAYPYFFGVRFI